MVVKEIVIMGDIIAEMDMSVLREDFPILKQQMHDKPLVYLDSAATSQKPQAVIDAIVNYYSHNNANVHRGVYALSESATSAYEAARQTVKTFINANRNHEIIFTKGTTGAINLVASSFGRSQIKAGDEILISAMEHHSNIVPWQIVCEQKGAILRVVPVNDDGTLDIAQYKQLLTDKTKIVALIHASNVLGTINPVKEMIALAHQKNVLVLLDGAQAAPHMAVDVQELDCDFYTFSAHKLYGPTGIGVLYRQAKTNTFTTLSDCFVNVFNCCISYIYHSTFNPIPYLQLLYFPAQLQLLYATLMSHI